MRLISSLLIAMLPFPLSAEINVIASTNDLAYLAERIGADKVTVSTIAPPLSDIHYIEVRPSYIIKAARADIALKIGMELDMWMDELIDNSRNSQLVSVNCSKYIKPLEVPSFRADASYGDLHRSGNPHYWLDPRNARSITNAIVEGFLSVDPDNVDEFTTNQEALLEEIRQIEEKLRPKLVRLRGTKVVYYHNSWPYFNNFIGLVAAGFIEPYAGVAPSPAQIKKTIDLINSHGINIIAVEPYFDRRIPDKIANETGARVVVIHPSIGGRKKGETYEQWLTGNVDALLEGLR